MLSLSAQQTLLRFDVVKVVEIKSARKGGTQYHAWEIQELSIQLLQFKPTNEQDFIKIIEIL